MHEYHLLEILSIGFAFALIFGYFAKRIGLSPIVGYLAAGFLIGPQSPGFVADPDLAHNLSEAGVILLMFGVGLHFNTDDLMKVKGVAVPGAVVQSVSAAACGIAAAYFFGYTFGEGLLLGLGLAVASTVVLLRVLSDNHVLNTLHGTVAVGWLVVEDIFTVLVLVLLPAVAGPITSGAGISFGPLLWALAMAAGKLAVLWVLVLVVGGKVVPGILKKIVQTRSQELFVLTILVIAFITAVGAAYIFDASFALGAFLGGMVVGKSNVSHQAGVELIPLRDAFAVLFFLSVGMLFDPQFIMEEPWIILASLAIVLLVKPFTTVLVVLGLGYSVTTALTVASGLAQVGEFSFILAQTGLSLNLINQNIYSILVACALVSIALNPFLVAAVPGTEKWLKTKPRLWDLLNMQVEKHSQELFKSYENQCAGDSEASYEGIIVGFGPSGRNAAEVLEKQGIIPVVVDMNIDTVADLNRQGKRAVFGHAGRQDILEAAGIHRASYMVITIPETSEAAEIALTAKTVRPEIRIFARARFFSDQALLEKAGADYIVLEEEALAEELAETMEEVLSGEKPGREPAVQTL